MQALAGDWRTIPIESASLGESDDQVPSTLSGAASVAAGLIVAPEPPPADVLGCSMGGMTAQILAIEHPELDRPTAIIDVILADI